MPSAESQTSELLASHKQRAIGSDGQSHNWPSDPSLCLGPTTLERLEPFANALVTRYSSLVARCLCLACARILISATGSAPERLGHKSQKSSFRPLESSRVESSCKRRNIEPLVARVCENLRVDWAAAAAATTTVAQKASFPNEPRAQLANRAHQRRSTAAIGATSGGARSQLGHKTRLTSCLLLFESARSFPLKPCF